MKRSAWWDTTDAQVQYDSCVRRSFGESNCIAIVPISASGFPTGIIVRCTAVVQCARVEDAADGVALISIPIHLSGKQGHDYDFQIEKE